MGERLRLPSGTCFGSAGYGCGLIHLQCPTAVSRKSILASAWPCRGEVFSFLLVWIFSRSASGVALGAGQPGVAWRSGGGAM